MSHPHIGIAAPQRTAIPPIARDTTASPYLDHVRRPRETVEDLIAAREIEFAKTTAAQRARIQRDLAFLRDELARIDSRACSEWRR
jgi:hypothetical protein